MFQTWDEGDTYLGWLLSYQRWRICCCSCCYLDKPNLCNGTTLSFRTQVCQHLVPCLYMSRYPFVQLPLQFGRSILDFGRLIFFYTHLDKLYVRETLPWEGLLRLWSTITRITRLFGNGLAAGAFFIHSHHNIITNTFSIVCSVLMLILTILLTFTIKLIVLTLYSHTRPHTPTHIHTHTDSLTQNMCSYSTWCQRNCFCDSECAVYGDCCIDAIAFDPAEQSDHFGRFAFLLFLSD